MMMLIIATLSRECGKQVNQLVTLIPFCFLRQPSKPNVPRRPYRSQAYIDGGTACLHQALHGRREWLRHRTNVH